MSRLGYLSKHRDSEAVLAAVRDAVRQRDFGALIECLAAFTKSEIKEIVGPLGEFKESMMGSDRGRMAWYLGNPDILCEGMAGELITMIKDKVIAVSCSDYDLPANLSISWSEASEVPAEDIYRVVFDEGYFSRVRRLKLGAHIVHFDPESPVREEVLSRLTVDNFPALEDLCLARGIRDCPEIRRFLQGALVNQLRRLYIYDYQLGDISFMEGIELPNLEELELGQCNEDVLATLTDIALPNVSALKLGISSAVTAVFVEALINSGILPQLINLHVYAGSALDFELFKALIDQPDFRPKSLSIYGSGPDSDYVDANIEALEESGLLSSLEELSINGHFTDRSLEILAPYTLDRLVSIELLGHVEEITSNALMTLAQRGASRLRKLSLYRGCSLKLFDLCEFVNMMPRKVELNVF